MFRQLCHKRVEGLAPKDAIFTVLCIVNLQKSWKTIGQLDGWRKPVTHIHSGTKKNPPQHILFWGLGFRVQRTSWGLLTRTYIPQCFALLVEEASWNFCHGIFPYIEKKNIPSIHPRPSFQKPHQGWFLLGYLWTSESLFLPLDAVQMSYCRCLGTKAVPTHRLADDKQVPKLSITDNAKENGHCLEKKGSSAELIWCLRDVEDNLYRCDPQ